MQLSGSFEDTRRIRSSKKTCSGSLKAVNTLVRVT
jgi:hypothetical protein